MTALVVWLPCGILGFLASTVQAVDRVALFTEWVSDRDSPPGRPSAYVDPVFFTARGPFYAFLNVGSFARGLEVGASRRDGRGSSYTSFLRRRQGGFIDDTALEIATAQKLRRFVGTASLRLQWPDDPEGENLLVVPSLGCELYTGSYSFAAFRAILDPRPDTGMAFMLSQRLSTRRAFIEAMLVPRTDGVLNWSLRGRWRWFHAGYSYEQDFDYSRIDRMVWTFGLQWDLEHDDLGS
jgi:hypothetical protein